MRGERGPRAAARLAWALNLRHLAAHRLRLLLSVAGVGSGVALAVAVGGLTSSINASVLDTSLAVASRADLEVRPVTEVAMPEKLLLRARAAPGVRAAAATVEARTRVRSQGQVRSVYLIGFEPGILALAPRTFSPDSLEGADPTGLLLPAPLARELGMSAGRRLQIYTPSGWRAVKIGGVFKPGPDSPGVVAATGLLVAQDLLSRSGRIDALYVDAAGSPKAVAASLHRALGPSVRIGPLGFRRDDVQQMSASITVLLTVAALVALFVGGFLVYNTMSMAAVERAGEAAILRAVGALRRQTLAVFAQEGAILGLLGSVIGVAAGAGLARFMLAARGGALEMVLPVEIGRLVLSPRDFALAAAAGVLVALAAALGPARRVARADPAPNLGPIAALEEPADRRTWRRALLGGVALAGGIVLAAAWFASPSQSLKEPLAGLFLFLVGVAIVTRSLVPALAGKLLGSVASSGSRASATLRLAAGETLRSPARTAFTVGALVLSLSLVVGFQNGIDSFERAFGRGLSTLVQADVVVRSQDWEPYGAGVGVEPTTAGKVAALPGVVAAYPSRRLTTNFRGRVSPVLAVGEQGYRRYSQLSAATPQQRRLNARVLGGGRMLISPSAAEQFGLRKGQEATLETPFGPRAFRIVGIYDDPSAVLPTFYITFEDAQAAWGLNTADSIDVFLSPGTSAPAMADRIERLLQAYGMRADTREEFIESVTGIIRSLTKLVSSVNLVAVLVAALGVANTLLMTTFERRRDLGVLRAVGMRRGELRRMVMIEALLLASLGVILSWAVGTGIGVFAHKMTELQTGLDFPLVLEPRVYLQVVLLGLAASAVAALYPAHRVGALQVTEALQYE